MLNTWPMLGGKSITKMTMSKFRNQVFYYLRQSKKFLKLEGRPEKRSFLEEFSVRKPIEIERPSYDFPVKLYVENRFDPLDDEVLDFGLNDVMAILDAKPKSKVMVGVSMKTVTEASVQTEPEEVAVEAENLAEEPNDPYEEVGFVDRHGVNKIVRNRKTMKAHSKLLNYLRCKFFLKYRDATLINSLVWEARNWMLKNNYSCDTKEHYEMMSMSVTCAYLVSYEEMVFRQTIKNKVNWDDLLHLNATVSGNLGKVVSTVPEHSLVGRVLPDYTLKPRAALNL